MNVAVGEQTITLVMELPHDHPGVTDPEVPGLVPSRTFSAALAARAYLSTQCIRHHSLPFYQPVLHAASFDVLARDLGSFVRSSGDRGSLLAACETTSAGATCRA